MLILVGGKQIAAFNCLLFYKHAHISVPIHHVMYNNCDQLSQNCDKVARPLATINVNLQQIIEERKSGETPILEG